jgi:DNA replication and repair protein RecF
MRIRRVTLRDFRNYERAELELGSALTVVTGPNGAGKTNLLEAIGLGCMGRSPRTANERELVRREQKVARVAIETEAEDGRHLIELGVAPGEPKSVRVDGAPVDNLSTVEVRPLVSVFMPERLELVKGPPSGRRAHVDQFVVALRPSRRANRPAYSRALAQRNALLARIRSGAAGRDGLTAWDAELAQHGVRLMADRREAVERLRGPFAARARELGLPGEAELRYRPRSPAMEAGELAAELAERHQADMERGFTAHGPHRDELQLLLGGEPLRTYGSQGQQRTALLALLFGERDVLLAERARPPLLLLDDVMSELDSAHRELLSETLRAGGQVVVTATEPDQVPGAESADVLLLEVRDGALIGASSAGAMAA